jgi:DNA-binding XRE family transcriptional regulator
LQNEIGGDFLRFDFAAFFLPEARARVASSGPMMIRALNMALPFAVDSVMIYLPRVPQLRSTKIVYRGGASVSTKIVEIMSPAQCRAGRALLEITQTQLATSAGLGLSTVVDFEKERRQVAPESIEEIRRALSRAGVEFIDENGGGPGVRLRQRQRAKQSK